MAEYTKEMSECIMDCRECAQSCMETMVHCLEMGEDHAEVSHISLLNDCAVVCDASAALMTSVSLAYTDQCEVCEGVCILCAESCEAFEDDEMMQDCAEVCRRCAESCKEMALDEEE